MTAPCKGCEDRHPLCHMECPKYLEYRKRMDRLREERRAVTGLIWANDNKYMAYNRKLNREKRNH